MAFKTATGRTPFRLPYGFEAITIPLEQEIPSLRVALERNVEDEEALTAIFALLEGLDEDRHPTRTPPKCR